jgi:hypothetical protein
MDHLDKLIPLAVLGVVGALIIVLLLRARRDQGSSELGLRAQSEREPEAPARAEVQQPAPISAASPVAIVTPAAPVQPAKPKAMDSPVAAVRGLLRKKDSLATALMLNEILGPPVSRRKRI